MPGDVVSAPERPGGRPGSPRVGGWRERLRGSPFGAGRLRAYWLSGPGIVMMLATALAVAIRLFTLSRSGYLIGITEYDDGVYLGAALRMTESAVPYKDFAFIQPPGILLLTALASAACVPLAGNLVRYRGTLVTLVTCGVLAVYPADVATAHTLMLEPWMNLFCLLGINAAFRRGHLAKPGHLAWAGLALGFAGAIKFWAVVPAAVLVACCMAVRRDRIRRVRGYLLGLAAGFVIPIAPFLAAAPLTFLRGTITDQAVRTGSSVPIGVRLANLTGLIDILDTKGGISLNAGAHSMFAAGASASVPGSSGVGWLPAAVTIALVAVIAAGYAWQSRRLSQLEWVSLVTTVLAAAAVLGYSAFFYHYADFPAPRPARWPAVRRCAPSCRSRSWWRCCWWPPCRSGRRSRCNSRAARRWRT